MSGPSLLLVATATRWLGSARMPRSLARAGFRVSLLAPPDTIAGRSRHVSTHARIAPETTPADWVRAFAATVEATAATFVLPCDDTAVRLLMLLSRSPPESLSSARQLRLRQLVADSLGERAHFVPSIDKTQFSAAAAALGLRVPPHAVVAAPGDARAFIARHGWPVVLKRGQSTAGEGVAVCANESEFGAAFARLLAAPGLALADAPADRLLIQAFIPGRTQYYAAAAWKGTLLAGFAAEKVAGSPLGPATVARYFRSPPLREATAVLARGFGMTGLFSPEFVVDEASGEPYMLELNRRISHATHRGALMGVDFAAALHAAMHGAPAATRADFDAGEEHRCAHFPQEWMRDPESPHLRECEVDVPWDEPELVAALVAAAMREFRDGR